MLIESNTAAGLFHAVLNHEDATSIAAVAAELLDGEEDGSAVEEAVIEEGADC